MAKKFLLDIPMDGYYASHQLRLEVLIYADMKEFRAETQELYEEAYKESDRFDSALFHGHYYKVKVDVKGIVHDLTTYNRRRVFATIHIPKESIGAGTFAHEFQHFIQAWIDAWKIDPNESKHNDGGAWETVAYLAGDMTRTFWKKYYKWVGKEPDKHGDM